MEDLLKDIKDISTWLRSGEECCTISLNHSLSLNPLILQHDDKLLPHWKELANAIQFHPNSDKLEEFAIEYIELPSSVLKLFTPSLKGKDIKRGSFKNNAFDSISDGIEFAVGLVNGLPSMERFDWINNAIEDEEHINDLAEAIISNPSIVDVKLEHCLGDAIDSYGVLCSLFASEKSFTLIDLEGNNIKSEGDIAIPDFISSNPPLQHLYLANNNLNDNDATLIARALKNNTNLHEIRLGDNNITNIGKQALLKAVYDPTSLNSLTDCNHSCTIEGISFDHRNTENDYDDGYDANRSKKIYNLLSTRNKEGSNVQHLNEEFKEEDENDSLSLKLVPKVLEFISQFDRPDRSFVHPLSIIYEILRGWKMPELYDSKRGNVKNK